MADKHAGTMTISLNPWRDGLRTAGRKSTIPETSLWQAQNVSSRLDGQFEKAPGLKQIGQTIKVPDADAAGSTIQLFNSLLNGVSDYAITDAGAGLIMLDTTEKGQFQTSVGVSVAGTENYTLSRSVPTLSVNSKWGLRFMLRTLNVPVYTAASTTANTFAFRAQGAAGSGKEFAVWDDGLYYKRASDNTYVLIAATEVVSGGGWVAIEVTCDDAGGNTIVSVNGLTVLTIASAALADVSLTASTAYEFRWRVRGIGPAGSNYSTKIATPMYNDTATGAFIPVPLRATYNYQYSTSTGSDIRTLLLAAGDFIYVDKGLNNAFVPLHPKQHPNVYFTAFQNKVIWFDHDGGTNTALWAWDGVLDPELQDDAPTLHFGSEAHGRLFGFSPEEPLRLYYSGDRQLNQWFSPTEGNTETDFDVALNAGFLVIPSKKRGDRIKAIYGGFYEFVIVSTKYSDYKVSGYGPNSFRVDKVGSSDAGGAANEHCITDIGNDLAILGHKGIRRLSSTEQYGDITSQFLSIDIQNLWIVDGNSINNISREFLPYARLKYHSQLNLLYAAVPLTGDRTASNVYVYNLNTGKWLGPWTKDSQVLEQVELASPEVEKMVHGGNEGRLGYTDAFNKWDFGDTAYTMFLESAVLDGRSIDPRLPGLSKTWKRLRLYVMPRGNWDITVTWRVPGMAAKTQTINQNARTRYSALTNDWRINDPAYGILRSREDVAFLEFQLDSIGTGLSFTVEQAGLGQDLVIQGAEVDFIATGYEKEQTK